MTTSLHLTRGQYLHCRQIRCNFSRCPEVSVVSGWKIRRELERLGQQVRGLCELLTDPAVQRRLDSAVAAGLPQIDGALPETDKVALF